MNDINHDSGTDDKQEITPQDMRLRVYSFPVSGSAAFSLSREDWKKVGKGALIVISGAALTAAADYLQVLSDQIDFGIWEAISIAGFSTLINLIRKWAADTRA